MKSAQNIIIIVEGGVVQEVTFPSLNSPAVEVRDYDVQGGNGKHLHVDSDGDPYTSYVWEPLPTSACSAGVDALDPEEKIDTIECPHCTAYFRYSEEGNPDSNLRSREEALRCYNRHICGASSADGVEDWRQADALR